MTLITAKENDKKINQKEQRHPLPAVSGWAKIPNIAEYAGMSDRTIRELLKAGLRHSRLPSGTVLIKYEWVDEFLKGFEANPNAEKEKLDAMVNGIVGDILAK